LREDSGLEEDSALDGADGMEEDSLIFADRKVENTHKSKKLEISEDKSATQRKTQRLRSSRLSAWRLEDKKLASKGLHKSFVNKYYFS
jgi:hypothetical protein